MWEFLMMVSWEAGLHQLESTAEQKCLLHQCSLKNSLDIGLQCSKLTSWLMALHTWQLWILFFEFIFSLNMGPEMRTRYLRINILNWINNPLKVEKIQSRTKRKKTVGDCQKNNNSYITAKVDVYWGGALFCNMKAAWKCNKFPSRRLNFRHLQTTLYL